MTPARRGPVIEHRNPNSLSGGMYGQATIIMRRAVADAMGWDAGELADLRRQEPHGRGLGYNQYADEAEAEAE